MTEEHKLKIKEGREKAAKERLAQGLPAKAPRKPREKKTKGRITVIVRGDEKDAFDFFLPIRTAFRTAHDYISSPKIIREITHSPYWNNPYKVIEIISSYADIKYLHVEEPSKKKKKEKKVRVPKENDLRKNRVLSPEHIAKMKAGRLTAKKAKEGNVEPNSFF